MLVKREYTTRDGTVLEFRPVSVFAVQRLEVEWDKRKPVMPKIEVEIGGRFVPDYNPNDPVYLDALAIWSKEREASILQYMFCAGIINEPPKDFSETHLKYFPTASDDDFKFFWLTSFLTSEDEISRLTNTLMGQTMVTEEGLKQAEDKFSG